MAVLDDNEYSNELFLKTRTENTLVEVEVELSVISDIYSESIVILGLN